jgi:hypothetical protein
MAGLFAAGAFGACGFAAAAGVGALCAGVVWATRIGATAPDGVAAPGVSEPDWAIWLTGARAGRTLCVNEARREFAVASPGALPDAALGADALCAETTPKAASPRLISAATTMTKNRMTPSMTSKAGYYEMKTNRLTSQREERFTGGKLRKCDFYTTPNASAVITLS